MFLIYGIIGFIIIGVAILLVLYILGIITNMILKRKLSIKFNPDAIANGLLVVIALSIASIAIFLIVRLGCHIDNLIN